MKFQAILTALMFKRCWGLSRAELLDCKNYLDVDVLYVSHLHKDHFDEETLKLLSKDITIVIPEFRQNRLIDKFKELGFSNFKMGKMSIGDTKINTYVSETVDRMMEDSMILISDGDKTFLNMANLNLKSYISYQSQENMILNYIDSFYRSKNRFSR